MNDMQPVLLSPHPELAKVKLLTCDVDGVLTDGGLYYGDDGERMKRFHVLDGHGLKSLQKTGVKTCFISQSRSPSIAARAADLGIDFCFSGIENKLITITEVTQKLGISLREVAHIADDLNDLTLLEAVGFPITVPNAVPPVKQICSFVTHKAGGQGAVRELCDAIVVAQSGW